MVIKLDDGERMSTNDFRLIEDKTIESIKLIIRII